MLKKFLQDYISYRFSHLLGGKTYTSWANETLVLHKHIPIKNRALAKELEDACQKKGFLTYAEFLTIDQFGQHGYHMTHKEHGMTDVRSRWPEALAALCIEKNISHIVEFGPGNGVVGVKTLLEARKQKKKLFWSGVELNTGLQQQTKKLFAKYRLQSQLQELVSSLTMLHLTEKCLFVFSYSLDNLIPDVFINTKHEIGAPDAMIGITVKDGCLSEVVIDKVTPLQGYTFAQHVQLNYMQRIYVPLEAYRILKATVHMIPKDSQILIIDEFREQTHKQTYHYGLPRDLETFSRDILDFTKFYTTAGSSLLYFPLFLEPLIGFLSQLGFSLEEKSGEHKLAYRLAGRNTPYPKNPRTFALLTTPKKATIQNKNFV